MVEAIGILLLTGFGALWLLMAANFASVLDWRAWLGVGLGTAALAAGAVKQMLIAQHLPQVPAAATSATSAWFWTIVSLEWILIIGAIILVARQGRRDLIVSLIALIVGLHFLPLAWIFGAKLYYLTGGVIAAASLAALALRERRQRQAVTCLACGMVLWLTSAAILLVPR
ncbi:MAG TPA: hypothetical protein VN934_00725 [Candidatus Tumulicola sp.]|nr:hypothetical protein [Candidatus Tumulicola sp.]